MAQTLVLNIVTGGLAGFGTWFAMGGERYPASVAIGCAITLFLISLSANK